MTAIRSSDAGGAARLLLITSLGIVLVPLNATMIALALPDIRSDLALSYSSVAWLIGVYLAIMAMAQPQSVGGRVVTWEVAAYGSSRGSRRDERARVAWASAALRMHE